MCQNVLIPSNWIHQKHYSLKIGSYSFFSSSDMQKFHHFLGCRAIGINSSFTSALRFQNVISKPKLNMNNSFRTIFIIISIIKVNIIKIYIMNTHSITRKYGITRIFIKIEYTIICIQSSKIFLNNFTCNKPIRSKF